MEMSSRLALLFAAIFGFLGVALGAFGAHGLKGVLTPAALETYKTGVDYQLYHALALGLVAALLARGQGALLHAAAWSFIAGVVLFSGSLYGLSLTGIRAFGPITPLGGLAFLAGWLLLGLAALRGEAGLRA